MKNDHKFVFVCGLHRSGTSILFRALRTHPLISGFEHTDSPENEGMHLQTVYRPSGHYGGAGKFGFASAAHLTEVSPLVTTANREKLWAEWQPYWDLARPFLLEKSPPNLIRTRFLQALFPDAYFITFMRHPVAVSLATRAWYRKPRINRRRLDRLIEHWLICHEIFRADSPHLHRQLILNYEAFVQNPQASLDRVFSWLGVESYTNMEPIKTNINEKYFTKWHTLSQALIPGYFIRRSIEQFEDRVNQLGYSLVDLQLVTSPGLDQT